MKLKCMFTYNSTPFGHSLLSDVFNRNLETKRENAHMKCVTVAPNAAMCCHQNKANAYRQRV